MTVATLSTVEVRISNVHTVRFVGLTIACALLNVGLYFLMWIVTPVIAGMVSGYLIDHRVRSAFSGAAGAVIAYVPLFLYIEAVTSFEANIITTLAAAGIMALVGAIGGLIGYYMRKAGPLAHE